MDEDGKATGKALRVTPQQLERLMKELCSYPYRLTCISNQKRRERRCRNFILLGKMLNKKYRTGGYEMATRKSTEAADSAETTVEKPANVVKKSQSMP